MENLSYLRVQNGNNEGSNMRVYITPRSITLQGHPSLEKLKAQGFELIFGPAGQQPSREEQLSILPECDAYLAGIERIDGEVLRSARKLKIISRNGVGIDNIDLETAKKLKVQVKVTSSANSQGVAELTIALILSAARNVPHSSDQIKKGIWHRVLGIEVNQKILGVIGCGNIGKRVVKMALGLGMKVFAYDLKPDTQFHPSENFHFTSLNAVIKQSDIITLHCPPGEHPIIDTETISKMKKGIYLINTARASVVDENSVLDALNSEQISIYATDVYQTEPPKVNALISHPNTITTPHIGGYTRESIDKATDDAVMNIINFFGMK
jgi:D-3-phosphoglycerate dehydrogenase